MPARGLTRTTIRYWVISSVVPRSSTSPKWRLSVGPSRAVATGTPQSNIALPSAQQRNQEHPPHSNQKCDGEPLLVQGDSSFTDSLHRRLKNPKRSKGYEGNNFTPKHKTRAFSPELSVGGSDYAAQRKPPQRKPDWRARETKDLEEYLQHVAHTAPSVKRVHALLRELIGRRSVKPTVSHYEALILSNCDAERGSSQAIKAVLQEMEREKMATGTAIFEAVLKVLAVHPDHLFRSSILDSMVAQWMARTTSMEYFAIAGCIREGQLELGLQGIQTMQQLKGPVGQWLYSLMMYSLCEAEDFDAVLRLIYFAQDERVDIPTHTLYHMLDRASECLHLDLTRRIWCDMVEPMYINPATGICHNVLLTAARAGDKSLAESVSQVLAHRRSKPPSDLEYDLLEETYVTAGDEEGAKKIRLHRETCRLSGEAGTVPRRKGSLGPANAARE